VSRQPRKGSYPSQALGRLANEVARTEGVERFDQLKAHLTGEDALRLSRAGRGLGVGESPVRVHVHPLPKRFGKLLREEVATTVADSSEVDAELRHLLETLGG
jgi:hypothetical protein